MVKKKAGLLFLMLLCMLILSACGHPEKKEQEIVADISVRDELFQECGLTVDQITIVKRQTNKDNKTDYAWVELTASNDDFIYAASYELTYILYNDGWQMEVCDKVSSSVTPKSYPTEEDARRVMDAYFEEYELISCEQGDGTALYSFERTESYHYLNTRYQTDVEFRFSPKSLWTPSVENTEIGYSLDIVGEWVYQDDERNFYVNIIRVGDHVNEGGGIDVTLSYYLENIHTSYRYITTLSSDGPVDMRINTFNSSQNNWSISTNPNSVYGNIWMYLGVEPKKLTESTGYGLSCDGYFLTKV